MKRISSESGSALKSPMTIGGKPSMGARRATASASAFTWSCRMWPWWSFQFRCVQNTGSLPNGDASSANTMLRCSSLPPFGSSMTSRLAIGQRERIALPVGKPWFSDASPHAIS